VSRGEVQVQFLSMPQPIKYSVISSLFSHITASCVTWFTIKIVVALTIHTETNKWVPITSHSLYCRLLWLKTGCSSRRFPGVTSGDDRFSYWGVIDLWFTNIKKGISPGISRSRLLLLDNSSIYWWFWLLCLVSPRVRETC